MSHGRNYWLRRWAQALRSGKYEQGRDAFAHDGKFCAVGVLYDIMIQDGLMRDWTPALYRHGGIKYWPGTIPPLVFPMSLQIDVTALNDAGYPFVAIARWLETQQDDEDTTDQLDAAVDEREAALALLP